MARREAMPWHRTLARLVLVAALGLVLWASAIAGPFVLAYVVNLHDTPAAAWTIAAAAASVLGVIAFLCFLMDRV